MSSAQPSVFERDLRRASRGEVYFDAARRGVYSTDASIYQIQPRAVFVPLDNDDVRAAVAVARQHGVSILPRGGGTSLAGQAVGASLIIDFSKHMDQVLEINTSERWARVQPGVVRDNLNAVLAKDGLHYAPDPATTSRANVGGMIGNNAAGVRSIVYGKTVDHTLATRSLLADGTELTFAALPAEQYETKAASKTREGEILRGFRKIISENRDEILRRFPKIMRRCGGYNLDEFVGDEPWNLSKVLVGSEGTLALTLEATLNLEPIPEHACLCVVHFDDLLEAVRTVKAIVDMGPSAVEILDRRVIELARRNLSIRPLCDFLEGEPEAVLIVEFQGNTQADARRKAESMAAEIERVPSAFAFPIRDDPAAMQRVWTVRKNGLGLMLGMKGDRKPLAFIEDAAVPLEVLAEYIERVMGICQRQQTEVAMYAHASVGLIHVRPILDLRRRDDIERMVTISEQTFELVKKYGGSWCGEHGDGLARSAYMERFFGSQLYRAFKQVKSLFDPAGLMNPGKIVDAPPIDQNLRLGAAYESPSFMTEFHFREESSFAAAVEACSGIGTCRQSLDGSMCPSYRATRDEEASVRGRANALRLAMSGQSGPDGFSGKPVHDILDLCLSCKACKSECPSNVDMARLKSEFLQHYHDRHGSTLRERLIADSRRTAELTAGPIAGLVGWAQRRTTVRWALERFAGFDRRRVLPSPAGRTFSSWFKRRRSAPPDGPSVALFVDTFTNFYQPAVGRAAVELLEACGFRVLPAAGGCCQRPRISHGFLREAKRDGLKTLQQLDPFIQDGIKIVVCEPSCASALTDDLPDLIDDDALGKRISDNVLMIDQFLRQERDADALHAALECPHERLLIHGHCHQKALYGTASMTSILQDVRASSVEEINAGCCGMAGSFGYEKEHYDLSQLVGEDRLFPAVRAMAPGTTVLACGFSCRHQIADATGVRPIHWVEALRARPRSQPREKST
ncbi:MAG: FAD-binding protein [Planctomycetes bacterium]|nr:FAD-binding protein [Planctomycetota bacterium]